MHSHRIAPEQGAEKFDSDRRQFTQLATITSFACTAKWETDRGQLDDDADDGGVADTSQPLIVASKQPGPRRASKAESMPKIAGRGLYSAGRRCRL